MKRLAIPTLVLVAVLGVFLAGCAKKETGPITLWAPGFGVVGASEKGTEYGNMLESNFQAYLDSHKNITFKQDVLSGTGGSDDEKLLALLATGQGPDVYAFGNEQTPFLGSNGALIDLAPVMKKDKSFKIADYYAQAQKGYEYQGKTIGIINGFTPVVIYFNKECFDKAGLSYPQPGWTWDDFLAAAKKLTIKDAKGKVTQWGYVNSKWQYLWLPWVWNNGGDMFSPDGKTAAGYMDSAATIEAVDFYAGLTTKEKVAPGAADWKAIPGGNGDKLLQGMVAMYSSGHWEMIGLKNSQYWDANKIGVVDLPQKAARATILFESGVGITKDSKHVDAAWDFVKYWVGEKIQQTKLITGIEIPGLIKTAEEMAKLNDFEKIFAEAIKYGRQPWGATIIQNTQYDDAVSTAMEEVMLGKKTAAQAMADAAKKMDAVFAE
jgi:multiple sugar transport system substrate-binding protein